MYDVSNMDLLLHKQILHELKQIYTRNGVIVYNIYKLLTNLTPAW